MLNDVLEDTRVELVDDLLADAGRENKLCVAEDGEVPRDSGPRGVEMVGNFAGREWTLFQEAKNIPSGGVGKCLERGVHDCIIS